MSPEVTTPAAQATTTPAVVAPVTPPAEAAKVETAAAKTAEAPTTLATEPAKADAVKGAPEAKVEPEKETKPASEQKPVVPEKYDLKLPKDSPMNAAQVEKLSSYAKEKGLSNEQAQSLLDRESEAVSGYASEQAEKQSQFMASLAEQAKNDKEIGGESFKKNVELASRVVTRFGTPEFKKELDRSGLGNHPELIRVFKRVGEAMSEDQLIIPGAQSHGKKSTASILYPDSPKKES